MHTYRKITPSLKNITPPKINLELILLYQILDNWMYFSSYISFSLNQNNFLCKTQILHQQGETTFWTFTLSIIQCAPYTFNCDNIRPYTTQRTKCNAGGYHKPVLGIPSSSSENTYTRHQTDRSRAHPTLSSHFPV